MITFKQEFTSNNNCIECKKRLGFPTTTNKCIYDIKGYHIITYKFKSDFNMAIHTGDIYHLTLCCGPNLMYYITPIATLHKKLLL